MGAGKNILPKADCLMLIAILRLTSKCDKFHDYIIVE
jgi:hypothetical protein